MRPKYTFYSFLSLYNKICSKNLNFLDSKIYTIVNKIIYVYQQQYQQTDLKKGQMALPYVTKMRSLLNQSAQTVPYIFQRFYLLLKKITMSMTPQKQSQSQIFEHYSLIYKTLKKYIKDQPHLLLNVERIQKELRIFLNPLLGYVGNDGLDKIILDYFQNDEINRAIKQFIKQSQNIKQQYKNKNIQIKIFGTHQIANSFWIQMFKTQNAVHFDIFWNAFIRFIGKNTFFQNFISASSKKSISKKVDPQKKFYITSSNVNQFFYKLSQPQFLQKLADQTAKGLKPSNFKSQDFLQLQFHSNQKSIIQTQLKVEEKFEISGQSTVIQQKPCVCLYPPTILFGSSLCDIIIKGKYISRKQFMIIQQEQKLSNLVNKTLPFSLVCLSVSNFTMISYNRQVKVRIGLIFKISQTTIQIFRQSNVFVPRQQLELSISTEDNDQTLQYLPSKSTHQISDDKQFQFIILAGQKKGLKGKICKQNNQLKFDNQSLQLIYKQNELYLPQRTIIYVKTANQVINGQLSNKIPIQQDMRIILEECYFQIK